MSRDLILKRLRDRARESSLFEDLRFGVRAIHRDAEVVNEPYDDAEHKESLKGLTIREIAERRIKAITDAEAT